MTIEQTLRCRALAAAVLHRAILDSLARRTDISGPAAEDAIEWLESDNDEDYSMLWICEQLDLCPHRVRNSIRSIDVSKLNVGRPSYNALAARFIDLPDDTSELIDRRKRHA